jgi:hypothetical protein
MSPLFEQQVLNFLRKIEAKLSTLSSQAGQILTEDTEISAALDTLNTTLTAELTALNNQLIAANTAAGSAVDLTPQINASSALLTKVQGIISGIPVPASANASNGSFSNVSPGTTV